MHPSNRAELASLFTGEGVELGVASGNYSSIILDKGRCTRLWSIDRWSDHHDTAEYAKAARKLIERGKGRCVPLRMTFAEALPLFKDGSLNFVYIDGYAHTGQDGGKTLEEWWPKLREGGIFAGHNYHPRWQPTVNMVDGFIARHALALHLTRDTGTFPSWWVRKPSAALLASRNQQNAAPATPPPARRFLPPHSNSGDAAAKERQKYEGIYSNPKKYARYGHTNHGAKALPILRKWNCKSLVDVGCGFNEFVLSARTSFRSIHAVGVDFACPGADVIACATSLPFADKEFEVVSAFDMLEHLLPEQVDAVLSEFARVAHRFIFSIATRPSVITWQGQNLHPTVESEDWWMQRIMRAGGAHLARQGNYFTGQWSNSKVLVPGNCILVGNGPSVLAHEHGEAIDAFDEVIRFNSFHLRGFEKHTGRKTTLWSTFGRGMLPADPEERPERILFTHGEGGAPAYPPREIYRIPRMFFNRLRAEVQRRTQLTGDAREALLPSSGLLVTSWLLDVVGVSKVHLTGFDHFGKVQSKQHHYWIPKAFGKPKEHDGDVEAIMFAEWRASGRIVYL